MNLRGMTAVLSLSHTPSIALVIFAEKRGEESDERLKKSTGLKSQHTINTYRDVGRSKNM